MRNISKLVLFFLIINCTISLKAQLGGGFEYLKQLQKEKQEQALKVKQKQENVQMGLIIGGILVIPLLIVSTVLLVSKVKEDKSQKPHID